MRFDRLKASIANNADQAPSLYMAFCMVETLFADLEAACGTEAGQCPSGDEQLPTKLIWLCRLVNEIYQSKDDELQRNRVRLNMAVEKLHRTQKELAEYSDAAKQLAVLQAEYVQLQKQLQAGQDAAQAYQKLSAQCEEAKRQLEQLRDFNPTAAKAELDTLVAEIGALKENKITLSNQLTTAKQRVDLLRGQLGELDADNQSACAELDTLTVQLEQQRQRTGELQARTEAACREREALEAERLQLARELEDKTVEAQSLRLRIETFREKELAPILSKLETAQKDIDSLEQAKQEMAQEFEQVSNTRNELVMEIARQKETNETTSQIVRNSQNRLTALKDEKTALDAKLSDTVQTLEALQTEVEMLETKRYPELLDHVQQEQQRQEELHGKVDECEAQQLTLREEIQKLEEQLPKLEEELKNNQEIYDALTASCAASTKELEGLERQIAELRNNNDREKVAIYRKQLEDNRRELEQIQAECETIQQENAQLLEKLETVQQERDRLREMKRKHEVGNEAAAKQLHELEFVNNSEYVHEVMQITQRLEMLERVRSKLSASINQLHQILGYVPVHSSVSLEDQLKSDLRGLRQRVDDLREVLLNTANSLKLEER